MRPHCQNYYADEHCSHMTGEALKCQFPWFPGNRLPTFVVQSSGAAGFILNERAEAQ